ncbi:MAG: AraC family transcriptional regulator, partial [Sciscionella sp.]
MLRDVVALVDAEIHAFELGVVCEVFGLDRSSDGLPCFDFAVCSEADTPLAAAGGMTFHAGHRLQRAATADLVVVPAWHVRDECPSRAVLDTLRA